MVLTFPGPFRFSFIPLFRFRVNALCHKIATVVGRTQLTSAQIPLLRFVVDLLHNKLCNKSTTKIRVVEFEWTLATVDVRPTNLVRALQRPFNSVYSTTQTRQPVVRVHLRQLILVTLARIAITASSARCRLLLQMECRDPSKNGWAASELVWNMDSSGPTESWVKWGPGSLDREGQFRGSSTQTALGQ